jgi:hypothetical protein
MTRRRTLPEALPRTSTAATIDAHTPPIGFFGVNPIGTTRNTAELRLVDHLGVHGAGDALLAAAGDRLGVAWSVSPAG